MSFPGVVKPSPWPGLQPHSGHLWTHHHHGHHNGSQANQTDGINEKMSSTHFKASPQAMKRSRDTESPTPSPFRQPPVFVFDDFLPKPTPTSSESSTPVEAVTASTPVVVKQLGDSEGSSAAAVPKPPSEQVSPTAVAKKKHVRRSRCGSCVGCTRRDNCGTCCVCTNPNATKSVCKLRRCELLKRRVSHCLSPVLLVEAVSLANSVVA